jgi:transposase
MNEVGRRLGVAPSSIMRWSKARDQYGEDGLKIRFSPGRTVRLKERELIRMSQLLKQGALAHGYDTNKWTVMRVAEIIKREFDVEYQSTNVHRLLYKIGWEFRPPDAWCPIKTS